MNRLLFLFCVLSTVAAAANIGDSYDQVIAEKGSPRSKVGTGPTQMLNYADVSIKLRDGKVVAITIVPPPSLKTEAAPTDAPAPTAKMSVAAIKAEEAKATNRVKLIVNQPVNGVPITASMRVAYYPIWFHDGANVPDFANVDVRQTRECSYDKFPFVASDLKPKVAYAGTDLEFNSATKIFYVDRTVPKKKLTEAEMLEINRLYRIIARCENDLRALQAK